MTDALKDLRPLLNTPVDRMYDLIDEIDRTIALLCADQEALASRLRPESLDKVMAVLPQSHCAKFNAKDHPIIHAALVRLGRVS